VTLAAVRSRCDLLAPFRSDASREPTMTEPTVTSASSHALPEHAKVTARVSDLTARIGELRRHL